ALSGIERRVEAGQKTVPKDLRVRVPDVLQRGQNDLRRERQGGGDRPGRQGPVVRPERDAPGDVAIKVPLDAPLLPLPGETGTGAGGHAPAILAKPFESLRVAQGVLLLDPGGAAAVFEIIG